MPDELKAGERLTLDVRGMAHGGEGIAEAPDGRVVFVRGAIPGDRVSAEVIKVKRRWARAETVEVLEASADRVAPACEAPACEAAAAGAGCCDFAHIEPSAQLSYKRDILEGQLRVLSGRSGVLGCLEGPGDFEKIQLQPLTHWRTRVRLGVDDSGRAGMRKAKSNDLVTDAECSQPVQDLLDGIVGEGAQRFTPRSELVVVRDSEGQRHVVETRSAQRGKRVERVQKVLEGSGTVTERVGQSTFSFPATGFWQAHQAAADTYCEVISRWGAATYERAVAWDLYGGVGAFASALHTATGGGEVHTVDMSDASAAGGGDPVENSRHWSWIRHHETVEKEIGQLPHPGLVVLDPPRSGAGAQVIEAIADAQPERVIHIGCDPATFARDVAVFGGHGFVVKQMLLVDAFPMTHHFEVLAVLERKSPASGD